MKLSWVLLGKIFDPANRFKAKEIDAILYLTQKQDDSGVVAVVHWREVAGHTGMTLQAYYDTLESLIAREIIEVDNKLPDGTKNDYGYRSIRIKDNNFTDSTGRITSGSIKAAGGYLDLDRYQLINNPKFHKLSPSEKKVVLHILKQHSYYVNISNANRRNILITLYAIMQLTGKQRRSAKKFAYTIFHSGLLPLSITAEHDLVWDKVDIDCFDVQPFRESQENRRNGRILSVLIDKKRVSADQKTIKEILDLLGRQYAIKASLGVQWIINKCLNVIKTLCPRYINSRCREFLKLREQFV